MSKNSQLCNVYNNPLLADFKSEFDRKLNQPFCNWSQQQDTGPMGNVQSKDRYKPTIPPPFMTLKNAYLFHGAPTMPANRQYQNL